MKHITEFLTQFDKAKVFISNPDAMELAIWYHDIIYVTGDKNNETRSADYAVSSLLDLGLRVGLVAEARDLILATRYGITLSDPLVNKSVATENDIYFMRDIDLSGFAKTYTEVIENARQIYNESIADGIDDQNFLQGRLGFLTMISHDNFKLYYTDLFSPHSDTARQNIRRELEELKVHGLDLYKGSN
jgi:predicted metal-dependent HD superfamily phosphohydrolase